MSQKLTLAGYLEGRGSVKSLTRIEAEAFGIPYPLVSGWPVRHAEMEITSSMLDDLVDFIAMARRSTAKKALRGMDGAGKLGYAAALRGHAVSQPMHGVTRPKIPVEKTSQFDGFSLRRAKRYIR